MVLVSLPPFLPRKWLSSVATCIGLTSSCCFAQPIFFAVESTPYDNQMVRVRPVLESLCDESAGQTSLVSVNQLMIKLRGLRYRYSKQWKTPAEVTATGVADCKGKAITLYEQMQAIGAQNIRFVIGKRRAGSGETHAWLEWETREGQYLLDPTFNWLAVKALPRSSNKYIPLYVYEGPFRYHAVNVTGIAQN